MLRVISGGRAEQQFAPRVGFCADTLTTGIEVDNDDMTIIGSKSDNHNNSPLTRRRIQQAILELCNERIRYDQTLRVIGVLSLTVDNDSKQEVIIKINDTLRRRTVDGHSSEIEETTTTLLSSATITATTTNALTPSEALTTANVVSRNENVTPNNLSDESVRNGVDYKTNCLVPVTAFVQEEKNKDVMGQLEDIGATVKFQSENCQRSPSSNEVDNTSDQDELFSGRNGHGVDSCNSDSGSREFLHNCGKTRGRKQSRPVKVNHRLISDSAMVVYPCENGLVQSQRAGDDENMVKQPNENFTEMKEGTIAISGNYLNSTTSLNSPTSSISISSIQSVNSDIEGYTTEPTSKLQSSTPKTKFADLTKTGASENHFKNVDTLGAINLKREHDPLSSNGSSQPCSLASSSSNEEVEKRDPSKHGIRNGSIYVNGGRQCIDSRENSRSRENFRTIVGEGRHEADGNQPIYSMSSQQSNDISAYPSVVRKLLTSSIANGSSSDQKLHNSDLMRHLKQVAAPMRDFQDRFHSQGLLSAQQAARAYYTQSAALLSTAVDRNRKIPQPWASAGLRRSLLDAMSVKPIVIAPTSGYTRPVASPYLPLRAGLILETRTDKNRGSDFQETALNFSKTALNAEHAAREDEEEEKPLRLTIGSRTSPSLDLSTATGPSHNTGMSSNNSYRSDLTRNATHCSWALADVFHSRPSTAAGSPNRGNNYYNYQSLESSLLKSSLLGPLGDIYHRPLSRTAENNSVENRTKDLRVFGNLRRRLGAAKEVDIRRQHELAQRQPSHQHYHRAGLNVHGWPIRNPDGVLRKRRRGRNNGNVSREGTESCAGICASNEAGSESGSLPPAKPKRNCTPAATAALEGEYLVDSMSSDATNRKRRRRGADEALTSDEMAEYMGANFEHTGKAGSFTCKYCSEALPDLCAYLSHTVSVHGSYVCHQCAKIFTTKSSLLRHRPIHTGMRRFTCSICRRTFYRKDKCKAHIRKHLEMAAAAATSERTPAAAGNLATDEPSNGSRDFDVGDNAQKMSLEVNV